MSYYNELKITPNQQYELFLDLIESLCDDAIEEDGQTIIIRTYDDVSDIVDGVNAFAKELSNHLGKSILCKIESKNIQDEDWIEKYKNSIQPILVGNFYVRPTWHASVDDKIEIVIDPALAFGSGHHETTSSCLRFIEEFTKAGDELLDVGCGSGILAIGASKLGAICDICDTDLLAVENAVVNFELNNVKPREFWEGSANTKSNSYDIVVANIVADVLVFISSDLKKRLKKDGILIMSGILDIHKDKVLNKFKNFEIIKEISLNEWYSVVLKEKN